MAPLFLLPSSVSAPVFPLVVLPPTATTDTYHLFGWFNSQNSGFWIVGFPGIALTFLPTGGSLSVQLLSSFSLFLRFIFTVCVRMFFQCACRCPVCMADTGRVQKKALDFLGLIGCEQLCNDDLAPQPEVLFATEPSLHSHSANP